jgi:prepilin-type N-terminal cleavage/methylation domain-containing protein
MNKSCRVDDAGMTLIELLVVLAVMALLGGLMTAGLHSAASGWRRVAMHNEDREQLESFQSLLHGLISQIYPARSKSGSMTFVQFEGLRDHIRFLAPLQQRFGAQDIVPYALSFATDGSLHVSWQLDRPSVAGPDDPFFQVVDEIVADCRNGAFSYYGQIDEIGASGWSTTWVRQSTLPRLVRLRFSWRGQEKELVVAPLVTGALCSLSSSPDAACSN